MFEQIKPTRKAASLLVEGKLGLLCFGGKSYIPDCYMEVKITPSITFIKIRNKDGIVVAKTVNVAFPKKWRSSIDTIVGPIAFEVSVFPV